MVFQLSLLYCMYNSKGVTDVANMFFSHVVTVKAFI